MSAVETFPVGAVVHCTVMDWTFTATVVGHTARRVRLEHGSGARQLAEADVLLDGRPALWCDGEWWTL